MGWFSKIFGGSKGGAPAPPPGPDPNVVAAEKTAQASQQAQTAADYANRGTVTDPWSTQTTTPRLVTDPATGKQYTTYDTTTTLDPQLQQALDAQQAVDLGKSQLAQAQLGRAGEAMATPFDWQNLQAWGNIPQAGNIDASQYAITGAGKGIMGGLDTASLGAMPQADAAERQRIEGMLFNRMRPEHQMQEQETRTRLINQGYQPGTPQYEQELQRVQRNQAEERFNAMQTGGAEMERLFGMGMQGRQQGWQELLGAGQFQNQAQQQAFEQMAGQQGQNFQQAMGAGAQNFGQQSQQMAMQNQLRQAQIAEQMQRRTMPLNELNALLSGSQVQHTQGPNFAPSQAAEGADYLRAQEMSYNAQKDAAAAKAAKKQGMMSGIGGIASTALMVF